MSSDALRLTPAAEDDLREIWLYGLQTWSEAQADRYLDMLLDSLEMLAEMPGLARLHPEITPPVRLHPRGSHVIVYTDEQGGVTILRVLGARQDWRALLKALD
ncbi:type II toxin-antitoxin system RelE/ParE family toxin [Pseudoroseicyclus aestuarii]|uniref:Toxin n=1 Tax=Pseudoroseicyclus aestuarii TaxID=1795041 RepID=A0A318SSB3_9RHOB|nr:type II toxin-antitoxin system RelE/ParE family toxin [Pseudoroseicyclus aestuarii]PYE80626.1 toxin ParE1/3/4 [Pseudoroseicyclus aestuarii]